MLSDESPAIFSPQPGRPDVRALRVEVLSSVAGVDAAAWDALAGDHNPFVEHGFLRALEDSGSVGAGTGWLPAHIIVSDADVSGAGLGDRLAGPAGRGRLRAAMPLYLKTDSYGEYIFDWAWADAAQRAGLSYYPKLVAAVPFTPVPGPRLLLEAGADAPELRALLLAAARRLAVDTECSSVHMLFCQAEERAVAVEQGYLSRRTYQFHWSNAGYADFDGYLGAFRSPARKAVRRERARAAASGLRFETLPGAELSSEQWDALYAFYQDTTSRKWGQAYLTRDFFELLRSRLAHRVLVTLARDGKRPVAGALCLQKGRNLYGRYWGCLERFDALHFELCYYRPLEYCIAEGLDRFEAGAQGLHKLKRGLLPVATHSAHYLEHPGLRRAVALYVDRERVALREEMDTLARHGPFKRGNAANG